MAKQIFILFILTMLINTAVYAAFPLKNQQHARTAGAQATEMKAGQSIMLKKNILARSSDGMYDGQWKTWNILLLCLLGIIVIAVTIILLNPE